MNFHPLDVRDDESMHSLLIYIDNAIQYGEDLDVKVPRVSCLSVVISTTIMLQ